MTDEERKRADEELAKQPPISYEEKMKRKAAEYLTADNPTKDAIIDCHDALMIREELKRLNPATVNEFNQRWNRLVAVHYRAY